MFNASDLQMVKFESTQIKWIGNNLKHGFAPMAQRNVENPVRRPNITM